MNVEDVLALTPNQEGILFHYLQNPEGDLYNIQLTLKLKGHVDISKFEKAWEHVVQCNEMLRTVFSWINIKQPIQVVLKKHDCTVEYYDFTEDKASFESLVQKDGKKPFDLESGCHRVKLCKIGQDEYGVIMSVHHIVYDGWSNGVLWSEFFSAYNSLCQTGEARLMPKTKYKQYIKARMNQDKDAQERFWKDALGDKEELTVLKEKRVSKKGDQENVINIRKELADDLKEQLPTFLKSNDMSLSNFVYSAWGILLQFYCNSNDVIFGRVSSGRNIDLDGIESMIGMFINVHPFRTKLDKEMTVLEYMNRTKGKELEIEPYEGTPLYEIKKYLGAGSNAELFNSIVVIENYPLNKDGLDNSSGLSVESFSGREVNHYDLTFAVEAFDDINFNMIFNNEVFSSEFIENILDHFNNILRSMIKNQNQPLSEIQILCQKESNELINIFNDTELAYDKNKNVIDLFEEQVVNQPDDVAIAFNDQSLTYKEFNEQANKVAHYLRGLGIGRNSIVGIMTERSIDMMVGIYGIVKAGGAYLPIDPRNPVKRIDYIIEDAGVEIILTNGKYESKHNSGINSLDIQAIRAMELSTSNLTKINEPEDSCYVIYTSGTTGNPKGVVIEHKSLVNRLNWMQKNTPIESGDVVLQKTTYVFDVSVWELFWWGIKGAQLCLLKNDGEKNPEDLVEAIEKHKVTTMHFVPSMLNVFLLYLESNKNAEKLSSLKHVITSGEALTLEMVNRFNQALKRNKEVRLVNLYGPTEATIDVSYYNCPRDASDLTLIPIGKPIDNTKLLITSPNGQMQPVNVPGELCINGVGLARGYLNREALTAEKFVQCSFMNGERVYKTGDLAKWLPDGTIEYLGRIDNQVKVRGYRVELGEIENAIRHHGNVEDVVVMVKRHDDGENYLYAYVLSLETLDIGALKMALETELPSYMVPSFVVKLTEFPIKTNGKVDKNELAKVKPNGNREVKKAVVAYQNDLQKMILGVWKEVIPDVEIGIHDNYFDIGGNSINLVRVYSKLQPSFPEKISITSLFQYTTVAALADYLDDTADPDTDAEVEAEQEQDGNKDLEVTSGDIAIVGMAGKFPGSNTINEYWKNIIKGVESIHYFTDKELEAANVDEALTKDPNYVNALGTIDGARAFDPKFFGFTPKEAELMDPQTRLLMANVWESLEDSGYTSEYHDDVIGLFAGASPNHFWETTAFKSGKTKMLGDFASEKLINKDHIATQISYKLNLTGPVFNVYTACSTSLVAVHLASQAILNNECTMAVAGGVSAVSHYGDYGYVYQEGMVFSPDGHCRAFDRDSEGFVGGMGAGSIVLKNLEKAQKDGDNIYAVIKSTAINNDGNRKIGYAAPSVEAQAEAVSKALKKAQIAPESIGYIETHGTGTPLGDPVEIKALELAFESEKKNFCAVGSVKANIGHLDCAAGIAGLIKATLALKNEKLPPAINFNIPNPKINFMDSPFYVNTEATDWVAGETPLRAGINALGLGGTNAHIILEQYTPDVLEKEENEDSQVLLLSAKSKSALKNQCEQLKKFIKTNKDISLEEIAYTLKVGRKSFEYRKAISCENRDKAIEALTNIEIEDMPVALEAYETIPVSQDKEFDEKNTLEAMWEKGANINWKKHYGNSELRKISLPTYPFDNKDYWIESNTASNTADIQDGEITKKKDIADWFYIPGWEPMPLQNAEIDSDLKWLLFVEDESLKASFHKKLSNGKNIVTVHPGRKFNKLNENEYEIDLAKEEDYVLLLKDLETMEFVPDKIIHSLCTTEGSGNLDEAYEIGFLSILYFGRAASKLNSFKYVELNAITQNSFSVSGVENLQPQYATVTSMCMVLSQEISSIRCRQIDIDTQMAGTWKEERLMDQLISEFHAQIENPIVAYRNNKRWLRSFHQKQLSPQATGRIKEEGVYVLIGGLGGVGLVLSRYLAQKKAKLVLVGRSAFPSREQWSTWLEKNDSENPISKKIKKLMEMEVLGAEVCTMSADATNEEQMKELMKNIDEKYGQIDGVVYAAVANDPSLFKTINEATASDCKQQFNPKVNGINVLEKALGDRPLDFCLIMSSTSSVLGGLGFVAYSAANAYMDAFTAKHNQNHPTQWITVNWESWEVETNQTVYDYKAEIQELSMNGEQGCEALERILTLNDTDQVVVSSGSLFARIEKWVYLNFLNEANDLAEKAADLSAELTSEYIAPESKFEEIIAKVWADFFGVSKVGIDDNLFELGATSLSIIQLNSNLRNKINRNIPIVKLFAYPTIRALVKYLQEDENATVESDIDRTKEVSRGRSSARRRMQLRKNKE